MMKRKTTEGAQSRFVRQPGIPGAGRPGLRVANRQYCSVGTDPTSQV